MEKEKVPEYLTPTQLADKLNVSIKFIRKHLASRRLPGALKVGGRWRFSILQVERALLRPQFLIDRK